MAKETNKYKGLRSGEKSSGKAIAFNETKALAKSKTVAENVQSGENKVKREKPEKVQKTDLPDLHNTGDKKAFKDTTLGEVLSVLFDFSSSPAPAPVSDKEK